MGKAQTIVGSIIPELVVLSSERKQAEQALVTKHINRLQHGLYISSCVQVPALLEFLS